MLARHRVSRAAIELIKRFEGYRQTAAQLPDGRWTIGYGHTLTAREGADVSEPDAEALLLYDLISVAHAVNENVYAPITQNQFDALCSFAFNIGIDNFRRSQVLKRLNAGAAVQAACAMELWRKADFEGERIVIDALVRRRASEKALFLTPANDAWIPAPSSVLRPVIDLDALDLVPLRRPVELETSFEGDKVVVRREASPQDDLFPTPEPAEEPAPAVSAAAEAVTARLETLFADPGEEPEAEVEAEVVEAEPEPEPEPEPETEPQVEEPDPAAEVRPQADFAPPISEPAPDVAPEPEPEPERVGDEPLELASEPAAQERNILDAELDIPKAPPHTAMPLELSDPDPDEVAPREFIPARPQPERRPGELSIIWDILLAILGLLFFGFAVFWGFGATAAASGGFVTPVLVAWTAGLAGVGFTVVAVFRLLQRLGREVEAD